MSKIIMTKPEDKASTDGNVENTRQINKIKLIEYMNKNKNVILSMSPRMIIYSSGVCGLSQATMYRTIKLFKDEMMKQSLKRLCPQLIATNN